MSNGEGYKDPTADQAIHNANKKPWWAMTAKEIGKIKIEKCRYCKYAGGYYKQEGISRPTCDYIGIVGHSRGCRPDECDKFVREKKQDRWKAMRAKRESG